MYGENCPEGEKRSILRRKIALTENRGFLHVVTFARDRERVVFDGTKKIWRSNVKTRYTKRERLRNEQTSE